jgi:hypothetical protein
MPKLTFSLDDVSVQLLRDTAARARKPLSQVVREAIAHYAAGEDALSSGERDRLLDAVRRIKRRPPTRPASQVDRELSAIRRSRRTGWSRPVR